MSISRTIGHCTIFGLVLFLFVKGALVLRPRETTAALSALIAALMHACCGSGVPNPAPTRAPPFIPFEPKDGGTRCP